MSVVDLILVEWENIDQDEIDISRGRTACLPLDVGQWGKKGNKREKVSHGIILLRQPKFAVSLQVVWFPIDSQHCQRSVQR